MPKTGGRGNGHSSIRSKIDRRQMQAALDLELSRSEGGDRLGDPAATRRARDSGLLTRPQ